MFRQTVVATFALGALAVSLAAQSKPNFSGSWTLNVSKSEFGPIPGPTTRTDVIAQNDSALKDAVTQDGPQGNNTGTINYDLGGKETTNQVGPLSVASTVAWEGANLIVNSKANFQGTDVALKAVWTLSPDGKTMTQDTHFNAGGLGEFDQKMVFEKNGGGAVASAGTAAPSAATNGGHPNYSGTWKLNVEKSDFGPLPPSNSRTDVIVHNDPNLKQQTTDDGAQGKQEYTLNMTTDGKEATNNTGDVEVKNTASWEGANLVVGTKLSVQGTDIAVKSTWLLSPDGKTLTQNAHIAAGALGELDQKMVFEKQ
ncbi:MAG TPA: hypothetical protein VEV17_06675 [Bryobacteraceae bacterium]|nr:hypothetical protein [Bryobacteraceae bacterium]